MEGLCFPLLFPHGEPGYTNASKSVLSPDEYVMSRLIKPEKIGCTFMTAQAKYAPVECVDSRTGQAFAPTEDQSEIEEHQVHGGSVFPRLRVNRFMIMSRLAQYWLMDFYSRVLDQRMSIIGKIRNRIMMGQTRQISDDLTEHEEQDRRVTAYRTEEQIIPPKQCTWFTTSHGCIGKERSDFGFGVGCPHVFLTLTSIQNDLK